MCDSNLVISLDKTILDALALIDKNKKGFLVVVDEHNKLVGTITDGDIRRGILAGKSLDVAVGEGLKRDCISLLTTNSISDAIEIFKNGAIKFLPVVDDDGTLINIVTKKQLQAMLLLDIHGDLTYDFSPLDEDVVDHEFFGRPWGYYKTTAMNQYFQSKIISVNPGSRLSLQSHAHREEYWVVANGYGRVQIDDSFFDVKSGSSVFIPKNAKHRLINASEKDSLIVIEVQIGDYFGEDDIQRYEDDYGRL